MPWLPAMTPAAHGPAHGSTPSCLDAFLAKCRDDDPEVGIHLAEIPLSQQLA
jgi:hypothetical protein